MEESIVQKISGLHGPLETPEVESTAQESKHPLSTVHTRREPSSMIMNAELSTVKVSVPSTVLLLVSEFQRTLFTPTIVN
jgi:hypothetical protein